MKTNRSLPTLPRRKVCGRAVAFKLAHRFNCVRPAVDFCKKLYNNTDSIEPKPLIKNAKHVRARSYALVRIGRGSRGQCEICSRSLERCVAPATALLYRLQQHFLLIILPASTSFFQPSITAFPQTRHQRQAWWSKNGGRVSCSRRSVCMVLAPCTCNERQESAEDKNDGDNPSRGFLFHLVLTNTVAYFKELNGDDVALRTFLQVCRGSL